MKTNHFIYILFIILSVLTGCSKTYEAKDVDFYVDNDINRLLSEVLEIPDFRMHGDVTYQAKEALEIQTGFWGEDDEFLDRGVEHNFVSFSDLLNTKKFTIKSTSYGGYKLVFQTKYIGKNFLGDDYLYKKIIMVHNNDSVVCKNIKFLRRYVSTEHGWYVSRPCSGSIEKYHKGHGMTTKTMSMKATEKYTIWKEYFPNGNIRSEKRMEDNEGWVSDNYDLNAFVTTSVFYTQDGKQDNIFKGKNYAVFTSNIVYLCDKKEYIVLFPYTNDNINKGRMVIFYSKYGLNWDDRYPFNGVEYSYEIADDYMYISDGISYKGISSSSPNRLKDQGIPLHYNNQVVSFTLNGHLRYGLESRCIISNEEYDQEYMDRLRRRYIR